MQQSGSGAPYAELLAFVAVAEERSFVRAARRLGRDATLLSRRIAALERRLGVRLLVRNTRAVALTESGSLYLERARTIAASIEDAEREVGELGTGEPRGHLRIALPGTFGRRWIAPLLAQFVLEHRRVSITADFSNRFVDLIGENFDLAVRIGPVGNSRLVARKLADRRRLVCAAPAYLRANGIPHTPGELADHSCLVFGGMGGARWEFVGADGAHAEVYVGGPLMTDDLDVLVQGACAGIGFLLGSEWLLGPEIRAGNLVRVLPEWTVPDAGHIHLLTPAGTRHASKTRAFSDFLAECFREPPWLVD